jgi:hypothetical protein
MHLSGGAVKSQRPKLAYAASSFLVAYVALTAIWVLPQWGSFESTQAFSIAKHLVIILLIVASLLFYPRVGSWVALAWCAFVPIERYGMLFQDISSVITGAAWSLAAIDVVRILLLLAACLLSGALVFSMLLRNKNTVERSDA